jgi:hypothetical protein
MDHWDVMELAKDCVQWWVLVWCWIFTSRLLEHY